MSLPNKTPNRTRSLGLRKSALRSTKSSSPSTVATKIKTTTIITADVKTPNTTRSTLANTSKSAARYKQTTPANKSPSKPIAQSVPANFTPYRLSLNRRLRDTMTKKRLEFHMAQEKEKAQTSLSEDVDVLTINDNVSSTNSSPDTLSLPSNIGTPTTSKNDSSNVEKFKRDKLIQGIEIVEEEMQARQRHISKTQELQCEIDRWRKAFHCALNDLQNRIEPYQTQIMLARSLGIDEKLLPNDNDDNS